MDKKENNIKWGKLKKFTFSDFVEFCKKYNRQANLEVLKTDYDTFLKEWNGMNKDTYERISGHCINSITDYIYNIYSHYKLIF